jgi:hypothetical protein
MRECGDLPVTRHVAVPVGAVDPFGYDFSLPGDDRAKGIFPSASGDARQLDATRHHRFVRGNA